MGMSHSHHTQDNVRMIVQCCSNVLDGGPTFKQHWVNILRDNILNFYSVSAVIGCAAGYKRLKKYNNNKIIILEYIEFIIVTHLWNIWTTFYLKLLLGMVIFSFVIFESLIYMKLYNLLILNKIQKCKKKQ